MHHEPPTIAVLLDVKRVPCPANLQKFVLASAILASALGFIDSTIVSIALPKIRESLDAGFTQVQWIGSGYVLFLAALLLLGGAAGDRYGVRRVFGIGIAGFVAASMLCALATSAEWLIVARCVQGMFAAVMVPSSLALIARNYPRAERGRAIGVWVAASSMTTALGPVVGGWLLTFGGPEIWRWVFAVNMPLGALALLLLWRVPDDAGDRSGRLDLGGAVLVTLAMLMLAFGLTLIGDEAGGLAETIPAVWVLAGAGVMAAAALWWESRAKAPMLDLSLFRSATFSGANLSTLLIYASLTAVLFFLPMVVVTGWGYSELYAGSMFLPFTLLIAILSPLAGKWADAAGPRLPLTIGPLVVAAGFAAIALAVPTQNYWWGLLPSVLLVGIGMGLTVSPLSTAIMLAVDDSKTGSASGINNMVARMAGLFAIAGFGAGIALLFAASVRGTALDPVLADRLISAGFGERLTGALYQEQVQQVHSAAMNEAFATMAFGAAGLCALAGLIGWFTLDGKPPATTGPLPDVAKGGRLADRR